jgi:hypothetical protein
MGSEPDSLVQAVPLSRHSYWEQRTALKVLKECVSALVGPLANLQGYVVMLLSRQLLPTVTR